MQGNRILNQFFHREQEAFGIRMFLQSGVEKFLDITKEMYQTFLFGECSDLVPVSVPEVGNQDAMDFLPGFGSNLVAAANPRCIPNG